MTARIGTNMNVAVESGLGSALTVTAVTKASPGVATSTAHGLVNGDVVRFTVSAGMVELDGQVVRVANKTNDTFELEGLDTTDYSTWSAGSAKEITTWATIANAQSISMPNPAPNKIETTVLTDKQKQYSYGLADAPDGTISGLYDPTDAAIGLIKAASKDNTPLAFRVSWAGGQKTLFNANVSYGSGFDLQQNQAATMSIPFTPIKDVMDYAS